MDETMNEYMPICIPKHAGHCVSVILYVRTAWMHSEAAWVLYVFVICTCRCLHFEHHMYCDLHVCMCAQLFSRKFLLRFLVTSHKRCRRTELSKSSEHMNSLSVSPALAKRNLCICIYIHTYIHRMHTYSFSWPSSWHRNLAPFWNPSYTTARILWLKHNPWNA
jgi:hypothetical protein